MKLFGKDDNSCRYRLHAYVSRPFLLGNSQGVASHGKSGAAADGAGTGRKSAVAAPAECAGRAAEIETQRLHYKTTAEVVEHGRHAILRG